MTNGMASDFEDESIFRSPRVPGWRLYSSTAGTKHSSTPWVIRILY